MTNETDDLELEMTELMKAHLDEVEGGGAHSSWRRTNTRDDGGLEG